MAVVATVTVAVVMTIAMTVVMRIGVGVVVRQTSSGTIGHRVIA